MRITLIIIAILAIGANSGAQNAKNRKKNPNNQYYITSTYTPTSVSWAASGLHEEKTISHLDLQDADVKQALKVLFEHVKLDYQFVDKEAPDRRISLKCDNIKLGTALDLITQSAGLKWTVVNENGKKTYKIGKDVQASNPFFSSLTLDGDNTVHLLDPSTGKFRATLTEPLKVDPNSWVYRNALTAPQVITGSGGNDLVLNRDGNGVYTWALGEERSTFICPHCKGQTTVIRHRQQPKCPKCNRVFLDDWQYCPFDGSKRPPTPGAWRFCPLCGKEVEPDSAEPKKHSELFEKRTQVIPLKRASADSVAQALTLLAANGVSATADPRTNSVVVVAPGYAGESIAQMIRNMDDNADMTRWMNLDDVVFRPSNPMIDWSFSFITP